MKLPITDEIAMERQTRLNIGISQCLLGENVRYDGGNKRLNFATEILKPYANYLAICPEMAIGLPSPRPTIGLYQYSQQQPIMRFNEGEGERLDDKMQAFCQQITPQLADLCGFIVCAKSPSCGLDNAKLRDNHSLDFIAFTDGAFTAYLRRLHPWMPIEDNQRLMDPAVQAHFIVRLFALHRLNQLKISGLTRHGLLAFHSRYKLLLLAHSQPLYRQLGPFVAKFDKWDDLDAFFIEYRSRLMELLSQPATTQNHTNVLMHMQGYFNRYLTAEQKKSFTATLLGYRHGEFTLTQAISCLKGYLVQYPDDYLSQQYYFAHYPDALPSQ